MVVYPVVILQAVASPEDYRLLSIQAGEVAVAGPAGSILHAIGVACVLRIVQLTSHV